MKTPEEQLQKEKSPENIIIPNPEKLKDKVEKIKEDGAEKIHILSDFDKTLTQCFVDGHKSSSIIAQVRNMGYLGEDYVKKAHELFDHYNPIEIDPEIDNETKNKLMHEWWMKHFDLLIEKGIDKKIIKEIVKKGSIKFRKGALEFIKELNKKNIPLVILSSAGIGNAIPMYLEKEGVLDKNIHIITNIFEFDENGKATEIKKPIVHVMNKSEITVKKLPIYQELLRRKNVLLLGDSLGDIEMIEGFDYDKIIKVGFLNENIEKSLKKYKDNFDIVITNDSDMNYVNDLLEKITNG